MQDQRARRKALYRRLYHYAKYEGPRKKLLAYMCNRLSNTQLADVVSMLDNDPDCQRPAPIATRRD